MHHWASQGLLLFDIELFFNIWIGFYREIRFNSPETVWIITLVCKLIDVIPGCRRLCPLFVAILAYQSNKSNMDQKISIEIRFMVPR